MTLDDSPDEAVYRCKSNNDGHTGEGAEENLLPDGQVVPEVDQTVDGDDAGAHGQKAGEWGHEQDTDASRDTAAECRRRRHSMIVM